VGANTSYSTGFEIKRGGQSKLKTHTFRSFFSFSSGRSFSIRPARPTSVSLPIRLLLSFPISAKEGRKLFLLGESVPAWSWDGTFRVSPLPGSGNIVSSGLVISAELGAPWGETDCYFNSIKTRDISS